MTSELGTSRVAVLLGGRSSEREVSFESGREVLAALRTPTGPQDRRGPREVLAVEIDGEGRWCFGDAALAPGAALERLADVDVFFLALHGGEGEGGELQGLLACHDRAFTGSGVTASAVCMDKDLSRRLVETVGLRVARAQRAHAYERRRRREEVDRELLALSRTGWAVKPLRGGSSVGVSLISAPEELAPALARAFEVEEAVLVEELVVGTEATVGVLDHRLEGPRALPTVEIRPHDGRFYDYEEKYSDDGAALVCPAESLSQETCARLEDLALRAHGVLRCTGYSRTDFIVPEAGGEPVFLEINTLPGLTSHSLVPRASREIGMDFRDLCLQIAADGLARGARR